MTWGLNWCESVRITFKNQIWDRPRPYHQNYLFTYEENCQRIQKLKEKAALTQSWVCKGESKRSSCLPAQEQEELSGQTGEARPHTAGGWTPGTPEAQVGDSRLGQRLSRPAQEAILTSGTALSSFLHLCFSLSKQVWGDVCRYTGDQARTKHKPPTAMTAAKTKGR